MFVFSVGQHGTVGNCCAGFTGDDGGDRNLVGGSMDVGPGVLCIRDEELELVFFVIPLPPRSVGPGVNPSLLSLFEEIGRLLVNSLISMRGLGVLMDLVLPLLDDKALPGRRGATSIASGVLSESLEETDEAR